MSRATNREERREQIAEAAWRVIERRGLEGVSMRDIAGEVGCTTGVLTHHFRDKRELMAHAYGLLVERVTARVRRMARERGFFEALCEALPLDENRRLEAAVWLTLVGASFREPALAEELRWRQREGITAGTSVMREVLGKDAPTEEDFGDVADDLMAAVDGITVDALADPERYPPERQIALLRRALVRLEIPTGSLESNGQ